MVTTYGSVFSNTVNLVKEWLSYKSNIFKIILIAALIVVVTIGAITLAVTYKYHQDMFINCNFIAYIFLSLIFGIIVTPLIILTLVFVLPTLYFVYRLFYLTITSIFFKIKYKNIDNVVRKVMNKTKRYNLSMGTYIARDEEDYSDDDKLHETIYGEYPIDAKPVHYLTYCCIISGVNTKVIPRMNDLLYQRFALKFMQKTIDIVKYNLDADIDLNMIVIIDWRQSSKAH